MSDAANKAIEYHKKGYNCAQAVACAFAEKLGKDEKQIFEIMEGFGLGMGNMNATCGAVSAMAAVVGMDNSDGDLDKPGTKKETYKKIRSLSEKFADMNSSLVCRELKGVDTGSPLRSCNGCIADAADILEEYFGEKENKEG